MGTLREDAKDIINKAIASCLPDVAVKNALLGKTFGEGRKVCASCITGKGICNRSV